MVKIKVCWEEQEGVGQDDVSSMFRFRDLGSDQRRENPPGRMVGIGSWCTIAISACACFHRLRFNLEQKPAIELLWALSVENLRVRRQG
jgi:hypothetical protein